MCDTSIERVDYHKRGDWYRRTNRFISQMKGNFPNKLSWARLTKIKCQRIKNFLFQKNTRLGTICASIMLYKTGSEHKSNGKPIFVFIIRYFIPKTTSSILRARWYRIKPAKYTAVLLFVKLLKDLWQTKMEGVDVYSKFKPAFMMLCKVILT